ASARKTGFITPTSSGGPALRSPSAAAGALEGREAGAARERSAGRRLPERLKRGSPILPRR
ncbi:MAG TPA: hypothetical protein VGZ22_01995, partial [Isosphaeraceae bacterium]|nr:hypothetical protein [Isosphaeraceae bacterium]